MEVINLESYRMPRVANAWFSRLHETRGTIISNRNDGASVQRSVQKEIKVACLLVRPKGTSENKECRLTVESPKETTRHSRCEKSSSQTVIPLCLWPSCRVRLHESRVFMALLFTFIWLTWRCWLNQDNCFVVNCVATEAVLRMMMPRCFVRTMTELECQASGRLSSRTTITCFPGKWMPNEQSDILDSA